MDQRFAPYTEKRTLAYIVSAVGQFPQGLRTIRPEEDNHIFNIKTCLLHSRIIFCRFFLTQYAPSYIICFFYLHSRNVL